MDLNKATMNIPTLDGSNCGIYATHLKAAASILDCWDIIKGEITSPAGAATTTYDRLEYLTSAIFSDLKDLTVAKAT